ncbi:MAG TPA: protein-tyrosine phosphatase family protein [Candidatus Limnocylindria bacterium]|nr:protein-tyrosine phosphatase family protein [Candidatus Limnocylindria bacterium]
MSHGAAPPHAGFGPEMRIDWIEPDALVPAAPGRLGLTFLPGKRGASFRYPGHTYRRDTAEDLAAMRAAGVVLLVLLVEDRELASWGDPAIVEIGSRAGLEVARHPMADGSAPAALTDMDRILDQIEAARGRGDVVVACMGGVGRTGTVAACALVRAGRSAREAIDAVRLLRHPTAVETPAQEQFVSRYAARRGTGEPAQGGPEA